MSLGWHLWSDRSLRDVGVVLRVNIYVLSTGSPALIGLLEPLVMQSSDGVHPLRCVGVEQHFRELLASGVYL